MSGCEGFLVLSFEKETATGARVAPVACVAPVRRGGGCRR